MAPRVNSGGAVRSPAPPR